MTGPDLLYMMKSEIKPAVGCTEPVAVALAAAEAARMLNGGIERIEVTVDPNVYKNGMGVFIPGTDKTGLALAAALGALSGDPELVLEVLRSIDAPDILAAEGLLRDNRVTVEFVPGHIGIYVEVIVTSPQSCSRVVISGRHDQIVYKELNTVPILDRRIEHSQSGLEKSAIQSITISDLIERVNEFELKDLAFFEQVISQNRDIAEVGLKQPMGMGVGYHWQQMIRRHIVPNDMINAAKAYAAAAADARMSGRSLPVMSCAGSGNQGLMASLPVVIASDFIHPPKIELFRALALSFLLTIYVKSYIGRLSALCGCAIAASIGAGAGIGYLLGLDKQGIIDVINNLVGDITGMICDGAKPGCSLKLMTAVDAAFQMALLSREGSAIRPGSGIVCSMPEDSIRNIGKLSKLGMNETDRVILDMMLGRCADSSAG